MSKGVVVMVIVPVLAGLVAVVAIGSAPETSAAWLEAALTRMETTSARLEMNAVAEMRGSAALGGRFAETTRATGELVPPDRLHLRLDGHGLLELVMIGHRLWVDEGNGLRLASGIRLGPLAEAQAPFAFIRGPGIAQFAGVGVSRGVPTYRIRLELDAFELQARMPSEEIDPDAVGILEIEVGLFDGLIRRQSVEVVEPLDPFSGTSLTKVRTAYTIEYWDHGRPLEVAEPR